MAASSPPPTPPSPPKPISYSETRAAELDTLRRPITQHQPTALHPSPAHCQTPLQPSPITNPYGTGPIRCHTSLQETHPPTPPHNHQSEQLPPDKTPTATEQPHNIRSNPSRPRSNRTPPQTTLKLLQTPPKHLMLLPHPLPQQPLCRPIIILLPKKEKEKKTKRKRKKKKKKKEMVRKRGGGRDRGKGRVVRESCVSVLMEPEGVREMEDDGG